MSTAAESRRDWRIPDRAIAAAGGWVLTPATIRYRAMAASRPVERTRDEGLRRGLNILVASLAILLMGPLMLLIAVAVKVSSRGPAIYKQPRVGLDRRLDRGPASLNHRRKSNSGGLLFTIYKFRTMRVDQGASRQVWASNRDPRITPVGRVLRAFRLDELPQLFNVLKGDMNIVGPRPEQPEIFAGLQREIERYRDRQRVLPGITGLAQVTLSYDQTVDDVRRKVRLDLEYMRRRCATQDLLIMAKTMPVMFLRKGSM